MPASGPPHGFEDDDRARLLRARPDAASIAWVERVVGGRVRSWRARRGGRSSAVHELRVEDARSGTVTAVVLRRYAIAEVVHEEPDVVEREAAALSVLERVPEIVTPVVLAADMDGRESGTPSLLMTRVPGRVDWAPRDLDRWLVRLATVLQPLHALPLVSLGASPAMRGFRPYEPASWDAPAWLRDASSWDRAVEVFHAPPVDTERAPIHRDFHPGNVLWRRGIVSGVVDWPAMCIGPTAVDAVHCKINLVRCFGVDVADRFVRTWEAVTGRPLHPWSEVVMLVDAAYWAFADPAARPAFEQLLGRALASLSPR